MRSPNGRAHDVLILGGGVAGATVAAHLAPSLHVALLEREPQLGLHATGRSSAMFIPSYGGPEALALTAASRTFFHEAPELFRPRPVLHVAASADSPKLAALTRPPLRAQPLDSAQVLALAPILRPEAAAFGALETSAGDIDAAALHARYLQTARAHGAEIFAGVGPASIDRRGDGWHVRSAGDSFAAPILVNAAGAWADEVAASAGVEPLGLESRLRTVILTSAPDLDGVDGWPTVMATDGSLYFRPFQGRLLVTGCDEEPSPPCDAAPSALGVALAVDRFERMTRHRVDATLPVRWSGLRTFAPGGAPRIGWAADAPGFFWVAGLGGFGIQTSPAVGRLAAAEIIRGRGRARRRSAATWRPSSRRCAPVKGDGAVTR